MNQSVLFTTYNQMKDTVETGRLNRALSIAQSKQHDSPYTTTPERCSCADWIHRIQWQGGQCKHQAALALLEAAGDDPHDMGDEPEAARRERQWADEQIAWARREQEWAREELSKSEWRHEIRESIAHMTTEEINDDLFG